MSWIFKDYFIWGQEFFFYLMGGVILAIIIACFALGYIEVKK